MMSNDLKLCLIKTDSSQDCSFNQNSMVGIYQWVKSFSGDIYNATDFLNSGKSDKYDLILIRLVENNYPLIHAVRANLGRTNKNKLLLCCDTPLFLWNNYFKDARRLRETACKADLIFATEYSISQHLSMLTGCRVYEIPYPADIGKIKQYQSSFRDDTMTVLYCTDPKYKRQAKELSDLLCFKPVFINYTNPLPKWLKTEDAFTFNENEELICRILAKSTLTVVPSDFTNYGKLIIYAASLGNIVIGTGQTDALRRCYPYTSPVPCDIKDYFQFWLWIGEPEIRKFLIDTAHAKVQYYNWENLRNRLLHILSAETKEWRFYPHNVNQIDLHTEINYDRDIQYIHGNKEVTCSKDDFVVISMVKNGTSHIESFMRHYQKMKAKHFFIVDNNSDDNTIEILKKYDNVTIYFTKLPHKLFECEIRKNMIERHCHGKWCLCVDIDELFDFPYSDWIGMRGLIQYLAKNNYTALVAYILDMFSENEFSTTIKNIENNNLENRYCYYDISNIHKEDYFSFNKILCNYNVLKDKYIKYYYGGIRNKYFMTKDNVFLLIKHPLLYIDNFIEPLTNPHYCNKAKVADITGVLRHYKFISTFKEKVRSSMVSDSDYDFFTKREYYTYEKILNEEKNLRFFSDKAKKYGNVNELVNQQFIHISKKFEEYVKDWYRVI